MAEVIKRRSAEKKRKSNRPLLKLILRISLGILLVFAVLLAIGFLKKDNINKVNETPKSFPVTVQN